jgi:AraC-like DNA-binding protein
MNRHRTPRAADIPSLEALAGAISKIAQKDGDHATPVPALTLHRRSAPTEPLHCIYSLGLGGIAQGSKQILLGDELLRCGAGQAMLTTIDLPVVSHVTQASTRKPFLGMLLTLDARIVLQLASEMDLPQPAREPARPPISIYRLDAALADALVRLVGLLAEPELVPKLSPLVQHEITIRLLSGLHSQHLLRLVASGSPNQQIARAVAWLKQNFTHEMQVDELAYRTHMSPSTFRQHFRAITGMSPLQSQKQLRLQEARQLMLNHRLDAGDAGGRVGYESPSQFSREYSRLFGAPPVRDVQRLRQGQLSPP